MACHSNVGECGHDPKTCWGWTSALIAHTDQVKAFAISSTTPNELKRRREPKKPTPAEQRRVVRLLEDEKLDADMKSDSDHSDESIDLTSDDEIDATRYTVEEICGHFHNDRGFWFLVKFEGYPEPTWEFEGLIDAPDKVTRYFKRICEDIG